MEKSEEHRNKWALGLTITLSVLIFGSFVFYKGYLSFGKESVVAEQKSKSNVATAVSLDLAPSPVQSTKETFKAAFGEINKQYKEFTSSLSDVFVPFITGIEVYERK